MALEQSAAMEDARARPPAALVFPASGSSKEAPGATTPSGASTPGAFTPTGNSLLSPARFLASMMKQADELDERQKQERMMERSSRKRSGQLRSSESVEEQDTSRQQSPRKAIDFDLKPEDEGESEDEGETEVEGEEGKTLRRSGLSEKSLEIKQKMKNKNYRWARKIGSSTAFKFLSVVGILLNVFFTGFFVDAKVKYHNGQLSSLLVYIIIESVFIVWFFCEVLVRILNHRSKKLWRDFALILDIVVILAPAIEIWILIPAGVAPVEVSVSIMSICRIFRLLRGVMMLSRIPAFKPLYLAIVGMWHSGGLLLANSVVVGTMLFTVSLGLCLMIGPSRAVHATLPQELAVRFASVSATFLTCTESLLRGVEWGPELVNPLMENKDTAVAGWVLLVFVVFGNIVVLNIIAGLFVHQIQSTGEISKVSNKFDDDVQVATAQMLQGLVKSFKEMDNDADGWLTKEEFLQGIHRESNTLAEIGIGTKEAAECFNTLDSDRSGCVSIIEFLGGLQDVIVQKSLEVLIFEHQQKRLLKGLHQHSNRSRKDLSLVQAELAAMNIWMEDAAQTVKELPQLVQDRLTNQKTRVQNMTEQLEMDTELIIEQNPWQNSVLTLSGSPSASPRLPFTPRSGPDPMMAAWQNTMKSRGVEAIRREISSARNGTFGRSY